MKLWRFEYVIEGECWLCISHKQDRGGYPRTGYRGVNTPAHRFVFQLVKGEIPKGRLVRHICDVRQCINPEHLILGTIQDNVRDREERGRGNSIVTWNRGENNTMTKLKNQDVLEIRKMRGQLPQSKIAKIFGITQSTVSAIQRGAHWKYLKEYNNA